MNELQKAVSLEPDDPEAYLFLGFVYHYAGNESAAKQAWANATRFDTPTGACGFYARQAVAQCERNQEPTMPTRR